MNMTLQTTDTNTDRDEHGRFTPGNPGGPGRPRRAVEVDYARTLADVCSLDDWKAICQQAVTDAKGGDKAAREFIANRLLGDGPVNLSMLALRAALSVSSDDELQATAALQLESAQQWGADVTAFQQVLLNRVREHETARRIERERIEAEAKAQRKAKREAAQRMDNNTDAHQ
jgi:hypothetical protein